MTAVVSSPASRSQPTDALRGRLAATPVNVAWVLALVFILSLVALAPGFTAARDVYFDETWYVPTARQWLADGQMLHPEHPPLAKMLIASGMKAFGDNPFGWRAASLVFGALTISGVWLWTLALTSDLALASFAAAVTLVDGVVFVQSRIAMLDIFLMAFGVFALAAFTAGENAKSRGAALAWHGLAGICLGLAGACKWSGFFLAAGLAAIKFLGALLRHWGARFEAPRDEDFYRPEAPALGLGGGLMAYVVAPFLAYFACYTPQLFHAHSVYEFIATHENMISIMTGKSADHPYKSKWWTWPWLWRPVWYLFDTPAKAAGGWTETAPAAAVVGLPNPVVLFAGEGAILWTLWAGLWQRARAPLIVAVAFFSQWLPWAIDPKGLEFYYYFYPSILTLGPALALAAGALPSPWRGGALGVCALTSLITFVYFLPILASGIGVGPQAFEAREWLPSWR